MKGKTLAAKIIAITIILTSLGISITNIGTYQGKVILGADKYTAQFGEKDGAINLQKPVKVNNKYNFNPLAQVNIEGKKMVMKPSTSDKGVFEEDKGSYSTQFKAARGKTEISQKLEVNEEQMKGTVTVTNKGGSAQKVVAQYQFGLPNNGRVFYPYAVDNATDSYVVLTDKDRKGLSLGVTANTELQGKKIFAERTKLNVQKSRALNPGESLTLEVRVKPVNIWTSENSFDFPTEHTSHLENPLFSAKGSADLNLSGSGVNRVNQALPKLKKKKDMKEGTISDFGEIDLSKDSYNSLEATMAIKEECIEAQVPCKIIIGKLGEDRYAWIKMMEGGKWKNLDPFKGVKSKPKDYTALYEEPEPQFLSIEGSSVSGENYLSSTYSLTFSTGPPIFLYLGVIIAAVAGIFILFLYSGRILRMIPSTGRKQGTIEKRAIEGKYEVLSEVDDIENESAIPVFEKMIEENGSVDTKRYSEETRYSEEFIKHSLDYLREEGHIKMKTKEVNKEKEESKEVEEEEPDEESSGFNPMKGILGSLKSISSKMGLTPVQLLLILLVLIGGAVAVVLLLL